MGREPNPDAANRSPRGGNPLAVRSGVALCADPGTGGGSARGAVCATLALEGGKAPDRIRLFPPGPSIKARDGRSWRLSDPQAVIAASMEGGLDLPIDWEHAQHRKARRGERADAAGWIVGMEAGAGGSIEARVEWTAQGRESIETRAYRFISPDFVFARASSEVLRILGAGLVNRPALAMPALASEQHATGGGFMEELKKILEALGLAADATAEKALAAVRALKAERDRAVAQAATPPIDKFVPRADHDAAVARATAAEAELASLRSAGLDARIKQALDKAQEAGKIVPASRDFYEGVCRSEGGLAKFEKFVEDAPEIAPASGAAGAPPPQAAPKGFRTAEEAQVAGLMGRDAAFLDEHAPAEED